MYLSILKLKYYNNQKLAKYKTQLFSSANMQ